MVATFEGRAGETGQLPNAQSHRRHCLQAPAAARRAWGRLPHRMTESVGIVCARAEGGEGRRDASKGAEGSKRDPSIG